jgi:hypothetical protein
VPGSRKSTENTADLSIFRQKDDRRHTGLAYKFARFCLAPYIGAVKIAGIHRISVILFERLNARVLPSPVPRACLLLAGRFALVIFRDAGKELDCTRVNATGC